MSNNKTFTNICIILVFTLIGTVLPSKAQFSLFKTPNSHIIGVDVSASMKQSQLDRMFEQIEKIVTDKVESGDYVFVVPIHAQTATGSFLAQKKIETKKNGKAGKIEARKIKAEFLQMLKPNLAYKKGAEKNATDLVGFFVRAQQIVESNETQAKLYVLSDMIHETSSFTIQNMLEWMKSKQIYKVSEISGAKAFTKNAELAAILPSTFSGTMGNEQKQQIRQVWESWFKTIGVHITHWESEWY